MLVTQANDLPVINGYPLLLSLLFHHLIDNAIKFTIPGQPALLNIAYKQPEPTPVAGMFPGIVITDHGIGFPRMKRRKYSVCFTGCILKTNTEAPALETPFAERSWISIMVLSPPKVSRAKAPAHLPFSSKACNRKRFCFAAPYSYCS